jgi:putative nucleotidyltransferase with HDIG domain
MLKRIEVSQLRAGMFVEAVEGSWQDNVLQRRRFFLRGEEEARMLRSANAAFVVINTAKGADIGGLAPTRSDLAAKKRTVAADATAARQSIEQSTQFLSQVFDQVRAGDAVSAEDVAPVVTEISKSVDRNPAVFISVTRLKSKDSTTFLHSISVSALMIHFARYLQLDETIVKQLGIAGLLHDVGKLDIPDSILTKEGPLTQEEMKLIRNHPQTGHAILSRQEKVSDIVLDVCLNHHERIDGKGYPSRLSGKSISLYARLAAICDVYDAVTSVRPYKKAWPPAEALKWMLQNEGQFDRRLLKKFVLCLAVSS